MRIYISGPMTGVRDLNGPAFARAAKALRECGYDVVSPPELDSREATPTWEGCLRRDIEYLMECDCIATLPRWKRSRGATLEVYIGKALKYPIHTVGYYLQEAE